MPINNRYGTGPEGSIKLSMPDHRNLKRGRFCFWDGVRAHGSTATGSKGAPPDLPFRRKIDIAYQAAAKGMWAISSVP